MSDERNQGGEGKAGKPLVRVRVNVDRKVLKVLERGAELEGIRTCDFFVDLVDGCLWLIYVGDDAKVIHDFHEIVSMKGDLAMKTAGEWSDSKTAREE
jgi:hypothetical protein